MALTAEQRASTNRRNAQKSTGPKSVEGKERTRTNALRHGFRSKFLLLQMPPQDRAEAEERELEWNAYYQPQSPAAQHLVNECVRATLLSDRVARSQQSVFTEQRLENLRQWDSKRSTEVTDQADDLRVDPADACERLRQSAMGCRYMIERWLKIYRRLDDRAKFSPTDAAEVVRLLGCATDDRALKANPTAWKVRFYGILVKTCWRDADVARMLDPARLPDALRDVYRLDALPKFDDVLRDLTEILTVEIDALKERAARLLIEEEGPARTEAAAQALVPDDPHLAQLQLRYYAESRTAFHRAYAALVKTLDRDQQAAAEPAPEPSPALEAVSPNEAESGLPAAATEDRSAHRNDDQNKTCAQPSHAVPGSEHTPVRLQILVLDPDAESPSPLDSLATRGAGRPAYLPPPRIGVPS